MPSSLGNLCDDRRRAGSGSATHAGRDEQHVRAFDHFVYTITVFHRRLATDIRIGAGTQAFRDVAANLQRGPYSRAFERLRVRIGADEIDTFDAGFNHVRYGVATAATDTDDFDDSALAVRIH